MLVASSDESTFTCAVQLESLIDVTLPGSMASSPDRSGDGSEVPHLKRSMANHGIEVTVSPTASLGSVQRWL